MKSKSIIITISIILVLTIVGAGFYFFQKRNDIRNSVNQNEVLRDVEDINEMSETKEIDISNWQTYRNEEYGFEVKYPKDWEYDLIDGVTFGDKKHCERGEIDEYWCKNYVTFSKSEVPIDFSDPNFNYLLSDILIPSVENEIMHREIESRDGGKFDFYIFNDQKGFGRYIIIKNYNNAKYRRELEIINKIVYTFKPLDI